MGEEVSANKMVVNYGLANNRRAFASLVTSQ